MIARIFLIAFCLVLVLVLHISCAGRKKYDPQLLQFKGREMVLVPAGEFSMGEKHGLHKVYLDSFYIDRFEVTNKQYQVLTEATGRPLPAHAADNNFNGPQQPVIFVSWLDAEAYCTWAGLRLPTEAEWEKAARGTDTRQYPWGNRIRKATANHGYDEFLRQGDNSDGYYYTSPVGSYPEGISPYGAIDMAGNVEEWVADRYESAYYSKSPYRNPQGPHVGHARVIRGGSWLADRKNITTTRRKGEFPDRKIKTAGFRCARDG